MGAAEISVVIPTRGRAALLERAIRSVVAQTFGAWELVVVIDGPDPETTAALAALHDDRVRVLRLARGRGGAGARNAGVRFARAEWIAFLDDDDEWTRDKLEIQHAAAVRSAFEHPVVACRVIARTPRGDYLWPRRVISEQEPISEYLFARKGLFQGEGLVQTSTLMARRDSLLAVPFSEGLERHQEWDWLLRALGQPGFGLAFAAGRPLAVWYVEDGRASISARHDWRRSLDWIESVRDRVTPRAFAAFVLVIVGACAARQRDRRAFRPLLRKAFAGGQPRAIDVLLYAGMWAIPQDARRALRALAARVRGTTNAATVRS